MKKLFTLVIVSFLSALAVQAQTLKVTKTDGSVVTYNVTDISQIEFLPATTPPGPTVLHEFTGYLTVTTRMFTNMYFGEAAKIKVIKDGDQYIANFSDVQWGTGSFNITLKGREISGSGKIKVVNPNAGVEPKEYDATMSGSMRDITINIPSLMGGTVVNWHYGPAPAIVKIPGTYSGKNQLKVGGSFGPFTSATVDYNIAANEDGTINVTVSEEKYTGVTMMGNLTLGTYTVKNLAYDEATHSFVRDYSNDGINVHLKSEGGMMTVDKDYPFQATSKMVVTLGENGAITVTNNYSLKGMPLPLSAVFTGTVSK